MEWSELDIAVGLNAMELGKLVEVNSFSPHFLRLIIEVGGREVCWGRTGDDEDKSGSLGGWW